MSAMRDMSRAIRHELSDHGHISEIPTPILTEYVTILRAFALDLQDELNRRAEADSDKPGE